MRMRLATALLVLVLAWSPVQHRLARVYDLDPWSFFGWAMYSVPNLRVTVRAGSLDDPSSRAEPDWNAISLGSYSALREFAERRGRLGRLLPPDDLAAELFRAQPDLGGLVVRVIRWRIAHDTARIVPANVDYVYAPPGQRVAIRE